MKGKENRSLVTLSLVGCLLLGALLNVSYGLAQQAPTGPSKEASGSTIPHKSVKGAALQWKDEEQKKSCETKARKIREHFLKAREFSIQGDSCSSEEEARSFGEKLEELKKECPSGFAEQAGFTPKVVKNVSTLQSLGKERCRNSKQPLEPSGPKGRP